MRCQNCSAENPEGAKFCIQCAAPFKRRCERCGFENPPGARFCAECAASLSAEVEQRSSVSATPAASAIRVTLDSPEPDSSVGERKTVTALFADIKGSMDLIEDIDPEDARAIVDPAIKLMIDAAHRYASSAMPRSCAPRKE